MPIILCTCACLGNIAHHEPYHEFYCSQHRTESQEHLPPIPEAQANADYLAISIPKLPPPGATSSQPSALGLIEDLEVPHGCHSALIVMLCMDASIGFANFPM